MYNSIKKEKKQQNKRKRPTSPFGVYMSQRNFTVQWFFFILILFFLFSFSSSAISMARYLYDISLIVLDHAEAVNWQSNVWLYTGEGALRLIISPCSCSDDVEYLR